MKKFKSILALTASVLALSAFAAPVSAFADETQSQTATHTEDEAYVVTIPATVTINKKDGTVYKNDDVVKASVAGKIAANKTLTITAASGNNQQLMCGTEGAAYDAKVGENSIFGQNAIVLSDTGVLDTEVIINYEAAVSGFTVAGDYSDTITFTIAVATS